MCITITISITMSIHDEKFACEHTCACAVHA